MLPVADVNARASVIFALWFDAQGKLRGGEHFWSVMLGRVTPSHQSLISWGLRFDRN